MNQAPTLGKMRKDKGIITPTLILPPQGGGELKYRIRIINNYILGAGVEHQPLLNIYFS